MPMPTVPQYQPFCSIECNREYSSVVVLVDHANDEPHCLNCGGRVGLRTRPNRHPTKGR